MWNLPARALAHDASPYSLAEDLRQRAYTLQSIGGRLDDVLVRVTDGDFLDAHVLRMLLDDMARATSTTWGDTCIPVSTARLALQIRILDRTVRRSVERLVASGLLTRARRGRARGGAETLLSCDPAHLAHVLDATTWLYLYDCFPGAPRPDLAPEVLKAVLASLAGDATSHWRADKYVRSLKTPPKGSILNRENTL